MIKLTEFVEKYLPLLLKAVATMPELMSYVERMREYYSQTTEWTPEQEAAFDARVEAVTSKEHWNPGK